MEFICRSCGAIFKKEDAVETFTEFLCECCEGPLVMLLCPKCHSEDLSMKGEDN